MDLILPNGKEVKISNDISTQSKIELCEELIKEFDDMIMDNPKNKNVKIFLNSLGDYLCLDKEDSTDWDKKKGILSDSREKQMSRKSYHGRYRKDTLFADLSVADNKQINGDDNSERF